jgi:hypothetical protein
LDRFSSALELLGGFSQELIARQSKLAHCARPMSDHDEPKTNDSASDRDEDRTSDSESEKAHEPATSTSKDVAAKPKSAAKAPAGMSGSSVALVLVLGLALGGAAGWFGHIQKTKAALKADSASSGSSGPCDDWKEKICSSTGAESAPCSQAKGAIELMTTSTCEAALAAIPATLSKVKAARASCDNLVTKLCADLPPGSKTCDMVKARTPSFPTPRCDEMLKHYDEVIGGLKQLDAQQGAMGGPGGPGMMPPGVMPPGMHPPGMTPPGTPPPGMPPH